MKTKELKGLPELDADASVTVWKMNNGFKNDMQEGVTEVKVSASGKKEINVNTQKMRMNWIVFGIYSSEALGIKEPSSIVLGLTDVEKKERLSIVRQMDSELADEIYDAIIEINSSSKDIEQEKKE